MDLLIVLGVAALLTRVGFALYAVGLVRARNSAATVLRTISDLCISVLVFWAIGAAILEQSHNSWFWVGREFLFGPPGEYSVSAAPRLFFYTVMILTATPVVAGAVAERCRFFSLCWVSLILAGFVLPTTCHWAWSGWFAHRGFFDLAGGASLHLATGIFAAVAVAMVGPRSGKYNRDGSCSIIPGHNLPLASIGALLLLVGWIPYVAGATILRGGLPTKAAFFAGAAAWDVVLAAAAAGMASIWVGHFRYGKPDVVLTLSGVIGGMVSLCAGGAAIPPWAAVIIGAIAGTLVPLAIALVDIRARIDDPLGVIVIHTVGGAWGTIAAGIFVPLPIERTRLQQIGIQIVGMLAIAIFSAIVAGIVFGLLKATVGLRDSESDEFEGLDLVEHDIGSYPDFQQNSIKSYHLRET